ncbi:MAG: hypothetical protein WA667_28210 [Candidatus Nitrosopolaris sp.]
MVFINTVTFVQDFPKLKAAFSHSKEEDRIQELHNFMIKVTDKFVVTSSERNQFYYITRPYLPSRRLLAVPVKFLFLLRLLKIVLSYIDHGQTLHAICSICARDD